MQPYPHITVSNRENHILKMLCRKFKIAEHQWWMKRNCTSLVEASAELSIRGELDIDIAFDLPSFFPELLPTRFLQRVHIRI